MSSKSFLDTKVFSCIGIGGSPGEHLKPHLWSLANTMCLAALFVCVMADIMQGVASILQGAADFCSVCLTLGMLNTKCFGLFKRKDTLFGLVAKQLMITFRKGLGFRPKSWQDYFLIFLTLPVFVSDIMLVSTV